MKLPRDAAPDVAALRALVDDLLERQTSMQRELDELRAVQPAAPEACADVEPVIEIESAVTRRGWMKAAAAAAVGGTAVALTGGERVAAAPTTFQLGTTNANTDRTQANHTGKVAAQSFLFQSGQFYDGTASFFPSALGGWTTSTERPSGVFGFTTVDNAEAYGVVGLANTNAAAGVLGRNPASAGTGVRAIGGSASGGAGVDAAGYFGVKGSTTTAESGAAGVLGESSGDQAAGVLARSTAAKFGVGLRAIGQTAVWADGPTTDGTGVLANGNTAGIFAGERIGMIATGKQAALELQTNQLVPLQRNGAHSVGQLDVGKGDPTSQGDSLWFCVEGGTPGDWRKLAGKDSSGVLHAITPARVYDSRRPAPLPGVISVGQSRLVSVKDGRDEATGAVIATDVVPEHARAVAYNVTLDQTVSAGFLAVVPGDVASSAASSINWSASGLILANAGIVKLDTQRQLNILCGGAGSTHFIVDITGYYL